MALAAAQLLCHEVTTIQQLPSLQVSSFMIQDSKLLCEFSTSAMAFAVAHTLAHLGIHSTKCLMSAWWVWAGMAADVTQWCRDCQFCQQAKVTKQPRAAMQAIPIPTRRFSHIHINLVGPLPRSPEGANHLFTMVDRSSRWLEAIPLARTDMATIAVVGHYPSPHHRIPPTGQREGQKGPPATQRHSKSSCKRRQLGVAPPLGSTGVEVNSQRRFESVIPLAGVWFALVTPG